MNFVEHAGISLTAACFASNRYVENAARRCFSNLLSIGFHWYEVDVYWDVSRQLWSLCPIQMGEDDEVLEESSLATPATPATSTTRLSMIGMSLAAGAGLNQRDPEELWRRQVTATTPQLESASLPVPSSESTTGNPREKSVTASSLVSSTSVSNTSSASDGSQAGNYTQLGSYACSESVDLNWLSRIMWTCKQTEG